MGGYGSEIHLLVLDRFPQTLNEYVVSPATLAVHGDADAVLLQHRGECPRGKLTALIAVEDIRFAVASQCLLQRIDTIVSRQRVREPPAEYLPRRPITATRYRRAQAIGRNMMSAAET